MTIRIQICEVNTNLRDSAHMRLPTAFPPSAASAAGSSPLLEERRSLSPPICCMPLLGRVHLYFFPVILADSGLTEDACEELFAYLGLMRIGNPYGDVTLEHERVPELISILGVNLSYQK